MTQITLDDDVVEALQDLHQPLESAARELIVLEFYRRGTFSSGKAAQLLGMDRLAFIRWSGELGIPFFRSDDEDLAADAYLGGQP